MRKQLLEIVASLIVGVCTTGCQDNGAKVIAQSGSIVSVGQADIQDWRNAADELVSKMLADEGYIAAVDRIAKAHPGVKPLIKITRIKNDTTQTIDARRYLLDPMEIKISKSRLVAFYSEDAALGDFAVEQRDPDLVLSGFINQLDARAGKTRQSTFTFTLKMANVSGDIIWMDQKDITKQGKKSAVGM